MDAADESRAPVLAASVVNTIGVLDALELGEDGKKKTIRLSSVVHRGPPERSDERASAEAVAAASRAKAVRLSHKARQRAARDVAEAGKDSSDEALRAARSRFARGKYARGGSVRIDGTAFDQVDVDGDGDDGLGGVHELEGVLEGEGSDDSTTTSEEESADSGSDSSEDGPARQARARKQLLGSEAQRRAFREACERQEEDRRETAQAYRDHRDSRRRYIAKVHARRRWELVRNMVQMRVAMARLTSDVIDLRSQAKFPRYTALRSLLQKRPEARRPADVREMASIARGMSFFRGLGSSLPASALESVMETAAMRTLRKANIDLFCAGDGDDKKSVTGSVANASMYVVIAGGVSVSIPHPVHGMQEVSRLYSGEAFGEGAFLELDVRSPARPRGATVTSCGPTQLMEISRHVFHDHLEAAVLALISRKRDFINSTGLFQGLSREERTSLSYSLTFERRVVGSAILVEGTIPDQQRFLAVVRLGEVQLYKQADAQDVDELTRPLGGQDIAAVIEGNVSTPDAARTSHAARPSTLDPSPSLRPRASRADAIATDLRAAKGATELPDGVPANSVPICTMGPGDVITTSWLFAGRGTRRADVSANAATGAEIAFVPLYALQGRVREARWATMEPHLLQAPTDDDLRRIVQGASTWARYRRTLVAETLEHATSHRAIEEATSDALATYLRHVHDVKARNRGASVDVDSPLDAEEDDSDGNVNREQRRGRVARSPARARALTVGSSRDGSKDADANDGTLWQRRRASSATTAEAPVLPSKAARRSGRSAAPAAPKSARQGPRTPKLEKTASDKRGGAAPGMSYTPVVRRAYDGTVFALSMPPGYVPPGLERTGNSAATARVSVATPIKRRVTSVRTMSRASRAAMVVARAQGADERDATRNGDATATSPARSPTAASLAPPPFIRARAASPGLTSVTAASLRSPTKKQTARVTSALLFDEAAEGMRSDYDAHRVLHEERLQQDGVLAFAGVLGGLHTDGNGSPKQSLLSLRAADARAGSAAARAALPGSPGFRARSPGLARALSSLERKLPPARALMLVPRGAIGPSPMQLRRLNTEQDIMRQDEKFAARPKRKGALVGLSVLTPGSDEFGRMGDDAWGGPSLRGGTARRAKRKAAPGTPAAHVAALEAESASLAPSNLRPLPNATARDCLASLGRLDVSRRGGLSAGFLEMQTADDEAFRGAVVAAAIRPRTVSMKKTAPLSPTSPALTRGVSPSARRPAFFPSSAASGSASGDGAPAGVLSGLAAPVGNAAASDAPQSGLGGGWSGWETSYKAEP